MEHKLPTLNYELNALEPVLSKETLDFHYGKHLQAYVNNLNSLIKGTKFEDMTLEDIILNSDGGIFNNAAQIWNHTFYFETFTPTKKEVNADLLKAIEAKWNTFDTFVDEMSKASAGLFGSGWAWLVKDSNGELSIVQTANAQTPLTQGLTPLFVIDVWEHAYYIDYRNRRPDYIKEIFNIVDWDLVASRLNN